MTKPSTIIDDSQAFLERQVATQKSKPGFAVDAYFYRSPIVYAREMERLIFRSWIYAAHISEIPDSGDYVLFEVGEDSIIICRDQQGEIHAMHNICRHRGSRVCVDKSGRRKTFVCPYHGWSYNLDGTLRPPRDMDAVEGFDKSQYNLMAIEVEVYMGMIFINFDRSAKPLTPALQPIGQPLGAYRLDQAKIAHQQTYRVNANWKLCLENYIECYHCATAHRKYARIHTLKELPRNVAELNQAMLARAEEVTGIQGIGVAYEQSYREALEFGCCAMSYRNALYDGFVTGSRDGKPVAPLMGSFQGFDGGAADFQMGPLTFMLNYPDHCVLYRFIPRGVDQTDMTLAWFVDGKAVEGQDYDLAELTWLWHHTIKEDEYIIMRNSEGVNSNFFKPGPYHPDYEYMCANFVGWYLDNLVSENESGSDD